MGHAASTAGISAAMKAVDDAELARSLAALPADARKKLTAALRDGDSAPSLVVIFLDVDGVCHPLKPSGHPLHASMDALTARTDAEMDLPDTAVASIVDGEFMSECMTALASSVRRTGAQVVLSTTWRETAPQRRCVDLQLQKNQIAPSIGATPMLPGPGGGRAKEIMQWVAEHRPTRWVAIDDVALPQLPAEHFVHTDPSRGFTPADAERVVALLGSGGGAADAGAAADEVRPARGATEGG
jgi:hypothetical protein